MIKRIPSRSGPRAVLRRLGASLVTLFVIAWLTLFGLTMAERGRWGLPAEPLSAAGEAVLRTVTYVTDHPTTYRWHRHDVSAFELVATTFGHSAGLLLVSLGAAVALGVPLGIAVALARRKGGASLVLLLSVVGISTPSFLLAMLFWVINIQMHQRFDISALPSTGFGWDAHMIMPALVLAARPLAQIAQVTYVSSSEVLRADYIRTARAKGLSWRVVTMRHVLRNALTPVVTLLKPMCADVLTGLFVVECVFGISGLGRRFIVSITNWDYPIVMGIVLLFTIFLVFANLLVDVMHARLNPQIRQA